MRTVPRYGCSGKATASVRVQERTHQEIAHGRMLAASDTERIWGWGTPAGRCRAGRRARLISTSARLSPGGSALELGCGTGVFTEYFAATGTTLVAVDLSPELLEKAKQRNVSPDRVTYMECRFEEAVFEKPFDAVVGSSVLHHMELQDALRHIYNALKPGGILAFAEPNMLNPQIFVERKLSGRPGFSHVSPQETAFFRWSLKRAIEKAGFVEVEIRPFDWLHPLTPQRWVGALNRLGRKLERIPVLCEFSGSLLICGKRPPGTVRKDCGQESVPKDHL